jgi:hypothetical protein
MASSEASAIWAQECRRPNAVVLRGETFAFSFRRRIPGRGCERGRRTAAVPLTHFLSYCFCGTGFFDGLNGGLGELEGGGGVSFCSIPWPASAELWLEGSPSKTSFSWEVWEIFAFSYGRPILSQLLCYFAACLIVLNQLPPVRASPS